MFSNLAIARRVCIVSPFVCVCRGAVLPAFPLTYSFEVALPSVMDQLILI